jgi:hypothetical protein
MDTMKDIDITFEQFAQEVTEGTPYPFDSTSLSEFYEDGYTVQDTLDWAEWRLECSEFEELGF